MNTLASVVLALLCCMVVEKAGSCLPNLCTTGTSLFLLIVSSQRRYLFRRCNGQKVELTSYFLLFIIFCSLSCSYSMPLSASSCKNPWDILAYGCESVDCFKTISDADCRTSSDSTRYCFLNCCYDDESGILIQLLHHAAPLNRGILMYWRKWLNK